MESITPDPPQPQDSKTVRYDISDFVNRRSFWISKIFMRGTVRSTLAFSIMIAILFFLTAIIFSSITFSNLQIDNISVSHIVDFFSLEGKSKADQQWTAEFYFMPIYLVIHFIMLMVIHFELKKSLKGRESVLKWLVKQNINTVDSVGRVMAEYYTDIENLMKVVRKNKRLV